MKKLFRLILRLTGQIDTELFEYVFVYAGEEYGGMRFCTAELGELFQCACRIFIRNGGDCECKQDLIHMKVRVLVAHVRGLQLLNRFDNGGGEEACGIVNACEVLECIEKHCGAGTEELGGLARNNGSVLELKRNGGSIGLSAF